MTSKRDKMIDKIARFTVESLDANLLETLAYEGLQSRLRQLDDDELVEEYKATFEFTKS